MRLSERIESLRTVEPQSVDGVVMPAPSRVDRATVKRVVELVRERLAEASDRSSLSDDRLRHVVELEVANILGSAEIGRAHV